MEQKSLWTTCVCRVKWGSCSHPTWVPELVAAVTPQAQPGRRPPAQSYCASSVSEKTHLSALASFKDSPLDVPHDPPRGPTTSKTEPPGTTVAEQSHVLQAGLSWPTVALSTSRALVFVGPTG